jgi:hypothetical protein
MSSNEISFFSKQIDMTVKQNRNCFLVFIHILNVMVQYSVYITDFRLPPFIKVAPEKYALRIRVQVFGIFFDINFRYARLPRKVVKKRPVFTLYRPGFLDLKCLMGAS